MPSRTPVLLLYPANERRHRVKYGLDCFLDHILDHFKGGGGGEKHTINTEGGVGYSLSVLREGWEAECYYSGRGERRTISNSDYAGRGGRWL